MSKKGNKIKKQTNINEEIITEALAEKKQFNLKHEVIAPLILVGLILIFLSPLLFLFEGICADDAAFQSFPKKMAVARAFQQGEIPFWDYNEFCGGKPFYIMLENPIYNIFIYPFYFMADLNNYDQSFYVLYILPTVLLVIVAGLGAYFLSRIYFKLSYVLSVLFGFLWAVNPSIALATYSTVNVTIFALIPWIILTAAQFMETKKWGWWVGGAFSVALFNCAYTVNYPVRIYFTLFIIFLILSVWYFIQNRKNIFTILMTGVLFLTGFFLSAFAWVHILEAAKFSTEQFRLTYENIVNFIPNSMPPTHIINMFIPNFNGSMDNIHAWGDGLLIYSADRNLTGGMFTSFAFIMSFAVLIFYRDWNIKLNRKMKIWLYIMIIINCAMLLVMMAKYTPLYYILCKILPWFFLIPYPFYYHFAHHLAAITLVIFGLHFFIEYKKEILGRLKTTFIFYYVGFIVLFIAVYMMAPVPAYDIPAYKFLSKYNEWSWFLTNPMLYFVIASALLIFVYLKRKQNFNIIKYTLIGAVFLEAFYIGHLGFYKNLIMPRPFERNNFEKLQRPHYTLPSKDPFYGQINELKKIAKESDSRWASDSTSMDGMSWMVNGRTLGGYDSKPIITNLRLTLEQFYKNFPYQLVCAGFPKDLMNNLNVGYIITYNNFDGDNDLIEYSKNTIDYYLTRSVDIYEKYGVHDDWADYFYDKSFKNSKFKIHELEKPMPYLYFQDKLFYGGLAEQKTNLFDDDLRRFSILPPAATKRLPDLTMFPVVKATHEKEFNTKDSFSDLQEDNRIVSEKRKYNTLQLKVSIKKQLLLVRCETFHPDWKVYIDGKGAPLMQVNYLMQGVMVNAGTHDIEFKFFPKKLKTGFFIALITFNLIALGVILSILLKQFRKKKEQ